jgi:hypothetical protein
VAFFVCYYSVWQTASPPICVGGIPTSRNQGVWSLANGVARHAALYDQSNDFHSTDSSTVWFVDRNEVESRRVAAICLLWPGEERLRNEVVARPVGNAGSSLLSDVPQERMAQLVGRHLDRTIRSPKNDDGSSLQWNGADCWGPYIGVAVGYPIWGKAVGVYSGRKTSWPAKKLAELADGPAVCHVMWQGQAICSVSSVNPKSLCRTLP